MTKDRRLSDNSLWIVVLNCLSKFVVAKIKLSIEEIFLIFLFVLLAFTLGLSIKKKKKKKKERIVFVVFFKPWLYQSWHMS